jgi:diguanylate cyclase (GGDEF)-like protein
MMERTAGPSLLTKLLDRAFERLARIAALAADAPVALIAIADVRRLWVAPDAEVDAAAIARDAARYEPGWPDHDVVVASDALADPQTRAHPLIAGESSLRSLCCVTLRDGAHEALGTLCVLDAVARPFTDVQVTIVRELGAAVSAEFALRLAAGRVDAESRLRRIAESQRARAEREARTDALTGLGNRRALESDLDALEQSALTSDGAIALVDIDDLKTVNDAGGHAAGDRYLRDFADELRTYFRGSDGIYRVGGDEFALVVSTGGLAAPHLRRRVEWVVDRLRGRYPNAGASVGVAQFSPAAASPRAALDAADRRMYEEKRAKRTRQGGVAVSE